MKSERHRLDSARVKKEDDEADSAADGLAKTCRQLARFYEQHYDMCLVSRLGIYIDGLVQDCVVPCVLAMEIPQNLH